MTVSFVGNYFFTNLHFFYTKSLVQGRNPSNATSVASLSVTNTASGHTRGAFTPLPKLEKELSKCEVRGKAYAYKSSLAHHMKTHTVTNDKKLHQCKFYGKIYAYKKAAHELPHWDKCLYL